MARFLSRPLAAVCAAVAAAAVALAFPGAAPPAQAAPPGSKDVTAALFEWNFASVARECTEHPRPGRVRLRRGLPAPGAHPGQPVVDVLPAGELPDRRAARRQHRVQEHGRHLPRRGREGRRRHRHQPHVRRIRDGHRRLLVHQVQLPGHLQGRTSTTAARRSRNYQDRANVQNCELVDLADLDTGRSTCAPASPST